MEVDRLGVLDVRLLFIVFLGNGVLGWMVYGCGIGGVSVSLFVVMVVVFVVWFFCWGWW